MKPRKQTVDGSLCSKIEEHGLGAGIVICKNTRLCPLSHELSGYLAR